LFRQADAIIGHDCERGGIVLGKQNRDGSAAIGEGVLYGIGQHFEQDQRGGNRLTRIDFDMSGFTAHRDASLRRHDAWIAAQCPQEAAEIHRGRALSAVKQIMHLRDGPDPLFDILEDCGRQTGLAGLQADQALHGQKIVPDAMVHLLEQ